MIFFEFLLAFLLAKDAPKYFAPIIRFAKARFGWNRVKPFDCESCSAFWITLLFCFNHVGFWNALTIALTSYFLMCEFIEYTNSLKDEIEL